jgi:transcriptional regulator with XRE-family HTH domain
MEPYILFGKRFKQLRQKTGKTLRQFCLEHNLDPGNYSKLERGKSLPPKSREKLENLANFLNIEEGSDEWYNFFDDAAACSGTIPKYIMDDEELSVKLPLVFRTIRGERVDSEKLKQLAEIIRRA